MKLRSPGPKARQRVEGPIAVKVVGPMAERLLDLSVQAGAESAEMYCLQALEWFVMEHRSGKVRLDPHRHEAQHEWESAF